MADVQVMVASFGPLLSVGIARPSVGHMVAVLRVLEVVELSYLTLE